VSILGGSRDGSARDAYRDGEERDGEGRDDDPKLRAMRAVWLAMRDEAPPERGLAELLAAARAKAGTMQVRPARWQRVIAGLGRPPALACAAVLVLVGGAVILGGRGVGGPAPARAPEVVSAPKSDDTAKAVWRSTPSSEAVRAPARASEGLARAASPAQAPLALPPARAAEPAKHMGRAAIAGTTTDVQKAPLAVPLGQLHRECESAARRGDCAMVRRMVGRITKSDRGYRARLAKDSPIAKCLAEMTPP
jgi:hypothetical protein